MSQKIWEQKHKKDKSTDWINKPTLFTQDTVKYFPKKGKILELGAGQGQDTRFFAEHGYDVVSTDLCEEALKISKARTDKTLKKKIKFKILDIADDFPFANETFDVVYAHLSLHYFNKDTTEKIFHEISRVLKKGGIFAFLVNSLNDPEYCVAKSAGFKGALIGEETDFLKIDGLEKRFFSAASARKFVSHFNVILLDEFGETYKDRVKGVDKLVRFIGEKPKADKKFNMAVPFVGGIIERNNNGKVEILMQTRWKPNTDIYSGTIEFPAGKLDVPYENIFDALKREIREECGLTLKRIKNISKTKNYCAKGKSFGFRPFCCVQQLKSGKPWIGFIFICEVENGCAKSQVNEAKDARWIGADEIKKIFERHPEKLFTLEIPAWEYYFSS